MRDVFEAILCVLVRGDGSRSHRGGGGIKGDRQVDAIPLLPYNNVQYVFGQVIIFFFLLYSIFNGKPHFFKSSLKYHFYFDCLEINTQKLRIVKTLFAFSIMISLMRTSKMLLIEVMCLFKKKIF